MSSITPGPRPADLFAAPRPVETVADLLANVWQLGYVTTDLDRALDQLGSRFGLQHHFRIPTGDSTWHLGDQVLPFEANFAMAARGGLIVELIEPVGGEVGFYRDALPDDGSFAIRLHHYAAFVPTGQAEWDRLAGMLGDAGLQFGHTLIIPGRVRAGYVDTRADLGHYLEICQLEQGDLDFFGELIGGSVQP
jgi:Glyoxalase/Bleomycin resistance protein/Dioxygenase superfamily